MFTLKASMLILASSKVEAILVSSEIEQKLWRGGKSHFVFIKFKINRAVTINLNLYGWGGMGCT